VCSKTSCSGSFKDQTSASLSLYPFEKMLFTFYKKKQPHRIKEASFISNFGTIRVCARIQLQKSKKSFHKRSFFLDFLLPLFGSRTYKLRARSARSSRSSSTSVTGKTLLRKAKYLFLLRSFFFEAKV
jgi:hypothetical protein